MAAVADLGITRVTKISKIARKRPTILRGSAKRFRHRFAGVAV
jgi:hypothetical protein